MYPTEKEVDKFLCGYGQGKPSSIYLRLKCRHLPAYIPGSQSATGQGANLMTSLLSLRREVRKEIDHLALDGLLQMKYETVIHFLALH